MKKKRKKKEEKKEEKTKETKETVETQKKQTEQPKSQEKKLLGDFVEKNGIGQGLFNTSKSTPTQGFFGNTNNNPNPQSNSLFGNLNNNGLFSAQNQTDKTKTDKTEPTADPKTNPETEPKEKFPIDQSKFKDPSKKSIFDNPIKTGLFDNLKSMSTTGLFSSNKIQGDNKGSLFSGGLFSKLQSGDKTSFFQNNMGDAEDDDTDKEDDQGKEESVDPKKVKMLKEYTSAYDTLINTNIRDFKEQAAGQKPPEAGFGCGSVSLEVKKTEKDSNDQKSNIVMFVYRNQAKVVRHQSILIKGLSTYKPLKSRKDAIILLTFKNCVESGKSVKYWVKVLFNEDNDAADFLKKLDEYYK